MKIKWTGKHSYTGHDRSAEVRIDSGEVAEVSDEKGAQMLADFPGQCEAVKAKDKAAR